MPILSFARATALFSGLAIVLLAGGPAAAAEPNPCNPCAAKKANPCNPCGTKRMNPCNPCAPKQTNPCGAKNPCNPCGAKGMNPCNPCGAGARIDPARFTRPAGLHMGGDRARLVAEGEKLWTDNSLSTNGAACATCHANYAAFLPTFAKPYPHEVSMVKARSGVGQVDAAEMVQFCMLQPMQADPLPWTSSKLAALAAYVEQLQGGFKPSPGAMKVANPCNPCGAKNPCSR
jgi:hypothetical protein